MLTRVDSNVNAKSGYLSASTFFSTYKSNTLESNRNITYIFRKFLNKLISNYSTLGEPHQKAAVVAPFRFSVLGKELPPPQKKT